MNEAVVNTPEQRERLTTEYSFVFCYHTEEFKDEIGVAVQDCDTVAFEYVGFQSSEERQAWEAMLTSYVSTSASAQQKAETKSRLSESNSGAYLTGVLSKLQGSNKKIALLDMDEDNPNYTSITDYWIANRNYYGAVSDGSTIDEVKQQSRNFLEAATKSFPIRDTVMTEQLKRLGSVPSKIGVVMGVIHSPVQDELKSFAETTATIIGPETKNVNGVDVVEYEDFDLAVQQARSKGLENVDYILLDRTILKDVIDSYDVDLGQSSSKDLVKCLSKSQVNNLLDNLNRIRTAHAIYTKGLLRMLMAKNEVVEALQAIWPTIPENPKVVIRKRS